ncbi:hypothetical protein AB1N83_010013 [Pleurotus pulmonarius]
MRAGSSCLSSPPSARRPRTGSTHPRERERLRARAARPPPPLHAPPVRELRELNNPPRASAHRPRAVVVLEGYMFQTRTWGHVMDCVGCSFPALSWIKLLCTTLHLCPCIKISRSLLAQLQGSSWNRGSLLG